MYLLFQWDEFDMMNLSHFISTILKGELFISGFGNVSRETLPYINCERYIISNNSKCFT